jgi:hypothetical protein
MSFPRILTAVLCGGFLLLGTAQAQQPARELRTCKLRLAWWEAPENPPELALQQDKDRMPFSPDVMSLSYVIDYRGEPNAIILKKTVTTEVDKAGKPIVQWLPYCTIPVGASDTDLAVLLFPDEKRGIAQTRLFDFSETGFPFGTVQLVNFTSARVAVAIDGSTFVANSRGVARCPKVFTQRTVSSFKMAVAEPNGEQKVLRSTTMVFRPTARLLLFALENPGADEDSRYLTKLIIDNFVEAPKQTQAAAPSKKGGNPTAQPKAKKGTSPPTEVAR